MWVFIPDPDGSCGDSPLLWPLFWQQEDEIVVSAAEWDFDWNTLSVMEKTLLKW